MSELLHRSWDATFRRPTARSVRSTRAGSATLWNRSGKPDSRPARVGFVLAAAVPTRSAVVHVRDRALASATGVLIRRAGGRRASQQARLVIAGCRSKSLFVNEVGFLAGVDFRLVSYLGCIGPGNPGSTR